jgi:DNA polymerase III delta subunit
MINPERLREELKSRDAHPVYLLLGENRGDKMDFVDELRAKVLSGSSDPSLAVTVFHGDDTPPEKIVENLRTYSFFTEERIVIVHGVDRLSTLKPLGSYVERPNDDVVLILLTEKKSLPRAFTGMVDNVGRSCIFWPFFGNQSAEWIRKELKNLDIGVTPNALGFIVDMTGGGKSELKNQLDILQNYVERGETLTLERAREITAALKELNVFDLVNVMFVRESGEILRVFRRLIENGEDLVKIHYFCSREIHRLYRCHTMSESGLSFDQIARKLKLRKLEAARIRSVLKRMSTEFFSSLFNELASLDSTIKTRPKAVARVSYEIFLAGLGGRDA